MRLPKSPPSAYDEPTKGRKNNPSFIYYCFSVLFIFFIQCLPDLLIDVFVRTEKQTGRRAGVPTAAFRAFHRGGERRGTILTVHSLEFMSAVIADKFCHSSKHKLFLSRLDYCPNRPSACGYCIPDDRFGFGRTKVLISCEPYKSIMVHGLQIHFNFSVFPIAVMLLFLFYGCKDTTKLCQIVA